MKLKLARVGFALDEIIAPDARLETPVEHFGLTEGPVWSGRVSRSARTASHSIPNAA